MNSERVQIVRSLRYGEFAPAYSTDELFRGVCHIVALPKMNAGKDSRRTAQEKRNGATRGAETQKKRAGERFLRRLPAIKEMLEQGHANKIIADRLGVCEALIKRYIARTPELKALSRKRTEMWRGSSKIELIRGPILTMQATGMSNSAIARALGMHRGNLWRYQKMIEQENKNAQG